MHTIQEIAKIYYDAFRKDYRYDWRFTEPENSPNSLSILIEYTSDEYLYKFLQLSLDSISKICLSASTPDEVLLSRDWSEPDFPLWESPDLWKWLISDPSHLDQVQARVSHACELGHIPQLNTSIQLAVWDEWRCVFEAVKTYLVEAYKAQPDDDEDCDDDE